MSAVVDCPRPHPLRDEHDEDAPHADLEVMGAHASACWVRCRKCGRWFWLETDTGRFGYRNEWELDPEEAERAVMGKHPRDVVALLVHHGLPHGPLWELPEARVALLEAMTEGATPDARIAALEGATLDPIFEKALAQMRAHRAAATRRIDAPAHGFAIDLRGDFDAWVGAFEANEAVFFLRQRPPYAAYRISATEVVEIPLAGRPSVAVAAPRGVYVHVEGGGDGPDGLVLFAAEAMIPMPLSTRGATLISPLQDEHVLLCPFEVGTGERVVELRDRNLGFVASFRVALPHHESYPSIPRRVGDGWLTSNVVPKRGLPLALALFDARFRVVAASRDERGPRQGLTVLPSDRFFARPEGRAFVLEVWKREGDALVLETEHASRALVAFEDVFMSLDRRGGLDAFERDGVTRRFHVELDVPPPTYAIASGDHVLVYGNGGRVVAVRARDGEITSCLDEPFPVAFAVDHGRRAYALAGPTLLRFDRGVAMRTELDGAYRWATSTDDAIVIARKGTPGHFLVVGADGAWRGAFDAPGVRLAVVTTRGGPYVIERDRLRIGALPTSP